MKKNLIITYLLLISFVFSDTVFLSVQHGPLYSEEKQINNVDFLGIYKERKIIFKIYDLDDIYFTPIDNVVKIVDNDNLEIDFKNKILADESIPDYAVVIDFLNPNPNKKSFTFKNKSKGKKNKGKRKESNNLNFRNNKLIFENDNRELFSSNVANWSYEAKNIFYQTEKISPEQALLYQFISPVPFMNLGYAYSDNWKKGMFLDIGLLFSQFLYSEAEEEKDMNVIALLSLGISIYKMVDVYMQAENYNDNLYESIFNNKRPTFSFKHSSKNNELLFVLSYPITSLDDL